MLRRRAIIFLSTAFLTMIGIWLVRNWSFLSEPRFGGRKLSEWCDQGLSSAEGGDAMVSASNAVWQIGERSIPWLVKWGMEGPAKWENWITEKSGPRAKVFGDWIETREALRRRNRERAGYLADTLSGLAGMAIPGLITSRDWNDEAEIQVVLDLIKRIGPDGLSCIGLALTNKSLESRIRGRYVLQKMGPEAASAGTLIWPQLDVTDQSSEQADLLYTLVVIRYQPKDSVAAISSRIRRYSSDPEICGDLYDTLRGTGMLAVPEFVSGLRTTNLVQRAAAFFALLDGVERRLSLDSGGEELDRPLFVIELDEVGRSVLAAGGAEVKSNCLQLVRGLLGHTRFKNSLRLSRCSKSTLFLGALAKDPDPSVSAAANAVIVEFGPLGRIQRANQVFNF
jgi:hypothetical protein